MKNLYPEFAHKTFYFNQIMGFLIRKELKKRNPIKLSAKERKALEIVKNPFLIISENSDNNIRDKKEFLISLYIKTLIYLYKYFYPGLYFISKLRLNLFSNSKEAIKYFCKIYPKNQNKLCLPRSIFASTTSKRFKENGVMFIGVFHPSRHMHAWIIEDGYNPCDFDNMWINFTPVALMS